MTIRQTLNEEAFEHLIRGGTIRLGDSEFALEDIGYDRISFLTVRSMQAGESRVGRVQEISPFEPPFGKPR
jgi:hypothetical protein